MKKLIFLSLLGMIASVEAQISPSIVFTYSVNSTVAPVTPTLSWNTSNTVSCTGSSLPVDPLWNGPIPISGIKVVGPIKYPTTYTIKCMYAADTTATLSWTAPYLNTDGTQLTNLAGFKAYEVISGTPVLVANLNAPNYTSVPVKNLSIGTHTFYVTAYNTVGVESAGSNQGSKTIVATSTTTKSVGVQVRKK